MPFPVGGVGARPWITLNSADFLSRAIFSRGEKLGKLPGAQPEDPRAWRTPPTATTRGSAQQPQWAMLLYPPSFLGLPHLPCCFPSAVPGCGERGEAGGAASICGPPVLVSPAAAVHTLPSSRPTLEPCVPPVALPSSAPAPCPHPQLCSQL